MPSSEPDIPDDTILDYVRRAYGIPAQSATLLPGVSDAQVTAYRIDGDEGPYFLKLRRDAPPPPLARHLADAGITGVLAPLSPRDQRRSLHIGERTAILYPFIDGENAFRRPLQVDQWTALGAMVRAMHDTTLPPSVIEAMRHETYSEEWCVLVRGYLTDVRPDGPDDVVAHEMMALLSTNEARIAALAEHAERLGASLRRRALPMVPCHGDLHAGNVLVDDEGSLTIVDWDDPVLAPRERDLMFVGAGIGGVWNRPDESDAFYRGYGPISIDVEALAYYRCERIIEDVVAFGGQLLLDGGDQGDDRRESLRRFATAFLPNNVVKIAERTFARL